MARVFVSSQTGAEVVVFSHDHCPPHVTARHRAASWMARLTFSFATNAVALWDVEPLTNAPRLRDINRLRREIEGNLAACRRIWWNVQQTTCLDNRWVRSATPPLTLLTKTQQGALQIVSATYDAGTNEVLIDFGGGPTFLVVAGTGLEA